MTIETGRTERENERENRHTAYTDECHDSPIDIGQTKNRVYNTRM